MDLPARDAHSPPVHDADPHALPVRSEELEPGIVGPLLGLPICPVHLLGQARDRLVRVHNDRRPTSGVALDESEDLLRIGTHALAGIARRKDDARNEDAFVSERPVSFCHGADATLGVPAEERDALTLPLPLPLHFGLERVIADIAQPHQEIMHASSRNNVELNPTYIMEPKS